MRSTHDLKELETHNPSPSPTDATANVANPRPRTTAREHSFDHRGRRPTLNKYFGFRVNFGFSLRLSGLGSGFTGSVSRKIAGEGPSGEGLSFYRGEASSQGSCWRFSPYRHTVLGGPCCKRPSCWARILRNTRLDLDGSVLCKTNPKLKSPALREGLCDGVRI